MPPDKNRLQLVIAGIFCVAFVYWILGFVGPSAEELSSLKEVVEVFGLAFWHVLTVPSVSKLALLVTWCVVGVIVLIWRSQTRFLETMLRTTQRQLEMYAKESPLTLAELLTKRAGSFIPEVLQKARYPGATYLPSNKSVMPGSIAIRLCDGAVFLNVVLRRPKADKHSVMLVTSVTFKEELLDAMRTIPLDPSLESEDLIISTVHSGADPLVLSPNELKRPVKKNKNVEPEDNLNITEAVLPPTMMLVEAIIERGQLHVNSALRQLNIASKIEEPKDLADLLKAKLDEEIGEPDHTA